MNKKLFYGAIFIFSLVFGGLGSAAVQAEEVVTGTVELGDETETELEEGTSGEAEVVCADASEPDCDTSDAAPEVVAEDGEVTEFTDADGEEETADEDSAADEAEEDEEEEVDPELWPLILSLSALGITIVFVVIINLCGRKNQ